MLLWVQWQRHIRQINVQHRIPCDSPKVANKLQRRQAHTAALATQPDNRLPLAYSCSTTLQYVSNNANDHPYCNAQQWWIVLQADLAGRFISIVSHNKLLNTVYTTCEHFTFIYVCNSRQYLHCHVVTQIASSCWFRRFQHTRALGTHQDEQLAAMLDLTPYSGFLYAFAKHIRCML